MVTREHVATIVDTLRELADEGQRGKAARTRIAMAALAKVDTKPNPWHAATLLSDELAPWCGELLVEVDRLAGYDADSGTDELLWLDAALVRVLAKVSEEEGAKARQGRAAKANDPRQRWELWADAERPLGMVTFAKVLWSRRVLEVWRRGVEAPAAMVRALAHDKLLPLGRVTSFDESSGEVRDPKGARIASMNVAAVDIAILRRGLVVFSSTLAHRLVRYFAHEAHRAELRGVHRPEIVLVDGGLVGLVEAIGCDPKKQAGKLRDLLTVGRRLDLSTAGLKVEGLWMLNEVGRGTAPGRRATLEVILNHRVFLKGAASDMKAMGTNDREAKKARRLVPILRHEPPYRVSNRAEWGRTWSVADAVLILLVDSAAHLRDGQGARIDSKAWARLVGDAGLAGSRVRLVQDVLVEGDGTSPPLLDRVGPDRFTLAPSHAGELAFIVARCFGSETER